MNTATVCVAVDDKYSDNNGPYQVAYFWDGEKVEQRGGMYDHAVYSADCTDAQLKAAAEWMIANTSESANWNKYCYGGRGANTYIGCTVKLTRSRIAPNNTPLKVIAFYESEYNGSYKTPERVVVTDGHERWAVSSGCIKELVKGIKDVVYWATPYASKQEAA